MATARDQYLAFQRFGYGARPGDSAVIKDDPRGAVLAELSGPDAALIINPALPTSTTALLEQQKSSQLRRDFRKEQIEQERLAKLAVAMGKRPANPDMAGDMSGGGDMADDKPMSMAAEDDGEKPGKPKLPDDPAFRYPRETYFAEIQARLDSIRAQRIGYLERLVGFWSNHFTVEADRGQRLRTIVGAYEREAIRPHVLGRFRDLLGAVVKHPAMQTYLDNFRSVGPNSIVGMARGQGLNENLAREMLELHTLGVDGGYTQADVTAFAKILTGWTLVAFRDPARPGVFEFSAVRHEPGEHRLLGRAYPPAGIDQGERALDAIASHPATARHIATKLAASFVADDPSPALVDRLAQVFRKTDGDLMAVSRALASDDSAWSAPVQKFRLPSEFFIAGTRALGLNLPARFAHRILRSFGEEPWNPASPQGFATRAADWIAPDALTNRLDFAEDLASRADPATDPRVLLDDLLGEVASVDTREAVARAESPQQGIALLLMSPEFQRR